MILNNFIVFEGGDGSGTSTQLELLRNRVSTEPGSLVWFFTFEPTDGPIGYLIRRALRADIRIQPATLAHLFAADRNEHLYCDEGIVERCRRGEIVVSDRYVLSSLVYQGLECGEDVPERLNANFPIPELLLYFDVEPQVAADRYAARAIKDVYEVPEFQNNVHRRYETLLPRFNQNGTSVVKINARATIAAVHQEVWRAIASLPIMKKQ